MVGGDAAGMSAASEARRADPDREIVVLERGPDVSYAACGIPYLISGEVADAGELVHHDPEYFLRRRGIEVRTGVEAVAVDPEARRVRCSDGDDVGYGTLVIATGARPVRPPVPGVDLPGVVTLRDLASARRLQDLLGPLTHPSVLLVGSGPIGLEMAEALIARGARLQIVESAPRVLPALDDEVAAPVVSALEEAGVPARAGATLERIVLREGRPAATIDGREQVFDLILLGTGVMPNSEIAAGAGCGLGERGAIAIDRRGRTTVGGIWAAGDCATAHHLLLGRQVWMPLATTANVQGRIAARDIVRDLGDDPAGRFAGTLGSWVSRFGEVSFGATGLDAPVAREAGFTPGGHPARGPRPLRVHAGRPPDRGAPGVGPPDRAAAGRPGRRGGRGLHPPSRDLRGPVGRADRAGAGRVRPRVRAAALAAARPGAARRRRRGRGRRLTGRRGVRGVLR